MNIKEKRKKYQTLKKELSWIDSFLESLETIRKRDEDIYHTRKSEWIRRRNECVTKINELG